MNHDLSSEPIGRVIAAKMDKEEDGSHFVRLQIAVTDPVAAQKISDQRYLTGSVGGRAGKAVCSISGEDLAVEDASGRPKAPKYKRGTVHKGKMAYIDMQDISFKEYSFVNQPADQRSSKAFVLHMNEEDIVSISENESILHNLKKKESRPLYLHMKGAFLSAIAIQESENSNSDNLSLLSKGSEDINSHEENSNMDENVKGEDILAAVEDLSQDLSNIAAGTVQESDPEVPQDEIDAPEASQPEEAPEAEESLKTEEDKEEEVAEETVTDEKDLEVDPVDALKKANEKIAQLEAQIAKDSSIAPATDEQESTVVPESVEELASEAVESANSEVAEESKVNEDSKVELTDNNIVSEQDADDLMRKLHLLEEENKKLKQALHRTLAERVVDTKISIGTESVESREELIKDHVTRSAGSLADTLRDLAKLPTFKKSIHGLSESILENDVVLEKEENVLEEDDEEVIEQPKEKINSVEELFVDALMGRRKL